MRRRSKRLPFRREWPHRENLWRGRRERAGQLAADLGVEPVQIIGVFRRHRAGQPRGGPSLCAAVSSSGLSARNRLAVASPIPELPPAAVLWSSSPITVSWVLLCEAHSRAAFTALRGQADSDVCPKIGWYWAFGAPSTENYASPSSVLGAHQAWSCPKLLGGSPVGR